MRGIMFMLLATSALHSASHLAFAVLSCRPANAEEPSPIGQAAAVQSLPPVNIDAPDAPRAAPARRYAPPGEYDREKDRAQKRAAPGTAAGAAPGGHSRGRAARTCSSRRNAGRAHRHAWRLLQ
jgi:hypothetical protein